MSKQSSNRPTLIGTGTWTGPEQSDLERWAARTTFLVTVGQLLPGIAAELGERLYPHLRAMRRWLTDGYTEPEDDDLLEAALSHEELVAVLRAWAQPHRLDEPWIIEAALRSLINWGGWFDWPPDIPSEPPQWHGGKWPGYPSIPEPLTDDECKLVIDAEWRPELGNWSMEYFVEVQKRKIDEWAQSRKRLLRDKGWRRAMVKQDTSHFEWLVLYHVKGLTPSKVLEELGQNEINESSVSPTVRGLADAIGLTLRLPSRGPKPRRAVPATN